MIVKTKRGDLPIKYNQTALARFADMIGISMDEMSNLNLQDLSIYKIYGKPR